MILIYLRPNFAFSQSIVDIIAANIARTDTFSLSFQSLKFIQQIDPLEENNQSTCIDLNAVAMLSLNVFPCLLLIIAVAPGIAESVNPYEEGDHVVNATTILNIQALQLEYNLRVFAPNETGTFRAVYFLSGFDGEN